MAREVTERDLRVEEFRDAKLEDLEFREDGKIVRKDRWEVGLRNIASAIGWARRSYEIAEVVEQVRRLCESASTTASERCALLDELIASWRDKSDTPEARERRIQARQAVEDAWAVTDGVREIPAVLFDGYAVLQAMSDVAKKRTSPDNVSDVLDAVAKLLRTDGVEGLKR